MHLIQHLFSSQSCNTATAGIHKGPLENDEKTRKKGTRGFSFNCTGENGSPEPSPEELKPPFGVTGTGDLRHQITSPQDVKKRVPHGTDDHITTIVWFTELVEIHEVLHSYDSTEWLWYLRRQGLLPDEMNSIGNFGSFRNVFPIYDSAIDKNSLSPSGTGRVRPSSGFNSKYLQKNVREYRQQLFLQEPDAPPMRNLGPSVTVLQCGVTGRNLSPTIDITFLPMRDIGDIVVQYFDIRRFLGRGGKIRLFLLAKQVKHSYEALLMNEETKLLQSHLRISGGSPTGQLPVITHRGQTLCETTAILRYLAKRIGEYGSSPYQDYLADMIMDKLAYWTDDLMVAISDVHMGEFGTALKQYLSNRFDYYSLFEKLFQLSPGKFFTDDLGPKNFEVLWTGEAPRGATWVDCAVVATIQDDLQLIALLKNSGRLNELLSEMKEHQQFVDGISNSEMHPMQLLSVHSGLKEMHAEICSLPLVREMLSQKEIIRRTEDGEDVELLQHSRVNHRPGRANYSAISGKYSSSPSTSTDFVTRTCATTTAETLGSDIQTNLNDGRAGWPENLKMSDGSMFPAPGDRQRPIVLDDRFRYHDRYAHGWSSSGTLLQDYSTSYSKDRFAYYQSSCNVASRPFPLRELNGSIPSSWPGGSHLVSPSGITESLENKRHVGPNISNTLCQSPRAHVGSDRPAIYRGNRTQPSPQNLSLESTHDAKKKVFQELNLQLEGPEAVVAPRRVIVKSEDEV